MGKVIYRGFRNSDEVLPPQVGIITGANLKRNTPKTFSKQKKKSKKPKNDRR